MSGAIVFVATNSPLNFGNAAVGTTVNATLILQNNNNSFTAQILSQTFAGTNPADFGYVSISDVFIGPHGGQSTVTLSFTPPAVAVFSATISFHYDNGNGGTGDTVAFPLIGTGVVAPGTNEVVSLVQNFRYLLAPTQGTTGKVLSYYDTTSFNDATDGATYIFKAEDIIADRVPTLRRVMITYIDLGIATLSVTVNAVNDDGTIVTQQTSITIGTAGASGLLSTAYADLSVTGYRPQITLSRAANAGPVAISHVVATGTIEKQVTL